MGKRGISLLAAGVCFAVAGVLYGRHAASERQHLRNCRLVPAKVVSKGKSLEERDGMQLQAYHIRYAFSLEGKQLEGRSRVDRESYAWLAIGSETEAYVDAADPRRSFLKVERDFLAGRKLRAVWGLLAGGAVALAHFLVAGRAGRRQAVRQGHALRVVRGRAIPSKTREARPYNGQPSRSRN